MKRKLLLMLFSLLSIQLSFAQLVVSETEINETLEIGVDKEMTVYLTNNSSETKTVEWVRTQSLPQGWITFVCDIDLCYPDTRDDAQFDIEAGADAAFKITFRAGTEGTGNAVVVLTDVDDPTDAVQVTYIAGTVTSDVDDFLARNIKVYPNPTSNNIYISNANEIQTMEIYNIIGKKVRTFSDVDSSVPYNIENLPRGMYLIRLLDDDSDVVTTKRISKR